MLPISSESCILFKILPLNIIFEFWDLFERALELLLEFIIFSSLLSFLVALSLINPYSKLTYPKID